MLALPQRKADASIIESISGYRGNLHKLGRLLRQVRHNRINSFAMYFWILIVNLALKVLKLEELLRERCLEPFVLKAEL